MFARIFLISIVQLYIFRTSFCLYYGHEVGHTSMESTHYDRRILQQQCPINNQLKESHQTTYLANFKSFPLTSPINNGSGLISSRKQFIVSYEEDTLVTRASSDTIDINNRSPLSMDQAALDIIVDKQIIGNLSVYVQVLECTNCPYKIVTEDLSSNKIFNLTINTKYNYRIRIELHNTSFCVQTLALYEYGQSVLNVQMSSTTTNSSSTSDIKCTLTARRSGNHIYVPLIVGGIILLILFIVCLFAQRMKLRERLINLQNRCLKRIPQQESTLSYDLQTRTTPTATATTATDTIIATDANLAITKIPPIHKISNVVVPRSKRLLSLDAFRGFAMIAMIFVNYGGGGYAQFEHVPWHGITFADIVFPFFVWMLGTSLVFSLKNSIDKSVPKRTLLKKIAIRTIKLFLIGFILNTRFKVDLAIVRILGVLQRFAIVYGVIATIEVLCSRPEQYIIPTREQPSMSTVAVKSGRLQRILTLFCDITNFPVQWLINIALAAIWVLVVYLVPYENCPAGYLGPGGLDENGKYENCTGGITGYIDRVIFTDKHLYQYPTCQAVYGCNIAFDPENLFGAMPTIFLAYLGVQAGRILVMYQNHADRLARLFTWSILSTIIGVGLTAGTLDSGPMPLNKNIWTLSFSFFTAGLAFAGFALMYVFIDLLNWWNATPFQYPGANSILIYVTHLVFATYFPVQWVVVNTHAAHLAMALWGCIFWIIIAYILFKKRIFLVL
ncbi:unnamed protein product [Rotaria socialis]|uniref:Heparan-alpha-glucosaminide N-acetyltransferase n=2 Tax=Rotaria socialis TaxID=392032 RepID=A0A820H199_9BILA|nr:unnamed protein product [Rotaria socialis]CAF3586334.1 unnamed protein product [Rotaria socialis]CAF4286320.1 unnamed protein product [Rotaria socialis]CAF4331229.1 unnamed protein product [Rotaria socialis]